MAAKHIQFSILAVEELHPGDGQEHIGRYDQGVARDRKGFPLIPHDTIRGLTRESLRRQEKTAALMLFGHGRQAGLYRINFTDATALDLDKHPTPEDWLVERSSTAIEFGGRRPKDHTLRRVLAIRRQRRFDGYAEIVAPESEIDDLAKHVVDGLKAIWLLGGGRSRGVGAVEVKAEILAASPFQANVGKLGTVTTSAPRLRLLYEIVDGLRLLPGGQAGANNETQLFVPGQTFLGALRAYWNEVLSQDEQNWESTGRLLASDGVSVGALLPLPSDFNETEAQQVLNPKVALPAFAPASLRRDKRPPLAFAERHLPPWAFELTSPQSLGSLGRWKDQLAEGETSGLKRLQGTQFLFAPTGQELRIYAPRVALRARNWIEEKSGVVKDGKLFVSEQLDAGQYLVGEVSFPASTLKGAEAALNEFWDGYAALLQGSRWLGLGQGRRPVRLVGTCLVQDPSPSGEKFVLNAPLAVSPKDRSAEEGLNRMIQSVDPGLKLVKCEALGPEPEAGLHHSGLPSFPVLALQPGTAFSVKGEASALQKLASQGALGWGIKREAGWGRWAAYALPHTPEIDKAEMAVPTQWVAEKAAPEAVAARNVAKKAASLSSIRLSDSQWSGLASLALSFKLQATKAPDNVANVRGKLVAALQGHSKQPWPALCEIIQVMPEDCDFERIFRWRRDHGASQATAQMPAQEVAHGKV